MAVRISIEQGVELEREIRADELRADDRIISFGGTIRVEVIEAPLPEHEGRMIVGGPDVSGRAIWTWHELRLAPESRVTVRCPRPGEGE